MAAPDSDDDGDEALLQCQKAFEAFYAEADTCAALDLLERQGQEHAMRGLLIMAFGSGYMRGVEHTMIQAHAELDTLISVIKGES